MSKFYRFHALDVATYIKWAHIAEEMESGLIRRLWRVRKSCLDHEGIKRFNDFRDRVYHELYLLWERGFIDEHSDLSVVPDFERYPQRIVRKTYARVEVGARLLTMHFLLTPQLPYVRQNIKTDMANLGYKNRSKTLAESILKLTDGLGLSIVRENGFPCDVQYLQAGGDVLVGLSAVRAQEVLEDKTGKKKVQDDAEPVRGSTWRPKYEPQPTYKRSVPIEKLDESHKYPQVETVELIPDHTEEDA